MTRRTVRQRPFSAVDVLSQEWLSLSHLPSEDDQKWATHPGYREHRKHPTARCSGPLECALALFVLVGFGAGQCPLVPSSAARIRQPKAERTNGRPRLPLEATYDQKAHLLQPDMKSGFFPQLTWLIEGEAGLFRSEVWQAGEAGNPEKNESVKQWLLPALATSSAWKEGGRGGWAGWGRVPTLGIGDQPEFRSLVVSAWSICKTHVRVYYERNRGSWDWGGVRGVLICSWKEQGVRPGP